MFDADTKSLRKLESDLKTFAAKAFPYATRNTIHGAATYAQQAARKNLRNEMILRNKWTEGGVQIEPKYPNRISLRVSEQAASIGGVPPYLNTQEFGGQVRGKSGKSKPIPLNFASGEPDGSQHPRKLPTAAKMLRAIKLTKGYRGRTSNQTLVVRARLAVKGGTRFIYLGDDFARGAGIYRVMGGRLTRGRGWPKGAKLKRVWNLSRPSVAVRAHPWLLPAVRVAQGKIPEFFADALWDQLRLRKVLGY